MGGGGGSVGHAHWAAPRGRPRRAWPGSHARGRAVWWVVRNSGVARFTEGSPLRMRRGGLDDRLAGVAGHGARRAPRQPGGLVHALRSRPPSCPAAWRAGGDEDRAGGLGAREGGSRGPGGPRPRRPMGAGHPLGCMSWAGSGAQASVPCPVTATGGELGLRPVPLASVSSSRTSQPVGRSGCRWPPLPPIPHGPRLDHKPRFH